MHSEIQLNDELELYVEAKIATLYHDLDRMKDFNHEDPYSLLSRIEALELGHFELTEQEIKLNQRSNKHKDDVEIVSYLHLLKYMKYSMIFTAAELQTSNHLLENSLQRWTTFMSTKDNWLFNFYSDDDLPLETRWRSLNALSA